MDYHKEKTTTVRFTPQDEEAIQRIKEMYGCTSHIAVIRLAIRMVARQEIENSQKKTTK